MQDVAEVPERVVAALRGVADPCCRERGVSVVDMGLLHRLEVTGDGRARVEILLTSGWCPFQLDIVEEITAAVEALPEIVEADVVIVLDEVWSPTRLSPDARRKLRFLPEPSEVADRDRYVATRSLPVYGGA